MTFGGEPLLYPSVTAKIHEEGRQHGVQRRELITNGYFSTDMKVINSVAARIIASGVTEIKLSMDAFHQESIPTKYVQCFIEAIVTQHFDNLIIHPAWLVSRDHDNEYNTKTKDIIGEISKKYGLPISNGNDIVLSGAAKEHLAIYYAQKKIDIDKRCGEIPFTNSLTDINTLRLLPNGNLAICRALVIGNIFRDRIDKILMKYDPHMDTAVSLLLVGGLRSLHRFAETRGGPINLDEYYTCCDLCADCMRAIGKLT